MKAIFNKNKTSLLSILDEKQSGYKSKVKNLKQKHKEIVIESVLGFPYFLLYNETQQSSPICFSSNNKEDLKTFIKNFVADNPQYMGEHVSCDLFTLVWHHEDYEYGDNTDCIGHIHMYTHCLKNNINYYDEIIDAINEKRNYVRR